MRYVKQYIKRGRWKTYLGWETDDEAEALRMAEAKRIKTGKLTWRIYDRKTRKKL